MDLVINGSLNELPSIGAAIPSYGSYWLNTLACINNAKDSYPLGELLKRINGLSGKWLVMSPICWQATHNDAFIVAVGDELQFSDEDSRQLFDSLSVFLSDEKLHYHDACHWLINVDEKTSIDSDPPSLMLNQSLMPALKRMDDSLYWQRLFTEIQMYLAQLPEYRDAMINGFWFYGAGELKLVPTKCIYTNDGQLLSLFPEQLLVLNNDSTVNDSSVWISTTPLPLTPQLQKQKTNWFWNNTAYTIPAKSWWKKLLSI